MKLVFEDGITNRKRGGSPIYSTPEWDEIIQKIKDTPPAETFNVVIPRGWGRELGLTDPFARLVDLLRTHCNNLEGLREVRRHGQKIQISAVVIELTHDDTEAGAKPSARLRAARPQPSG